jgi:hypothetical protein
MSSDSIVPYRMGPEAVELAAKMPPLARSVVHDEAVALINQWIDQVIDSSYENADACQEGNTSGGGLPLIGGLPLLP